MLNAETNTEKFFQRLKHRLPDANKGTYGKVLIAAGSSGMSGAAYLSGLAAYRAGAGLIKLLTAEDNRTILQTLLPEAIVTTYGEHSDVTKLCGDALAWADFLVLGPGIGRSSTAGTMLSALLSRAAAIEKRIPCLVDADGLNLLAAQPARLESLKTLSQPLLLTPHPMEMARLTGRELREILAAPEEIAAELASRLGCVIIMKGARSFVVDGKSGCCFRSLQSAPALAKGGSGDVLSGLCAGVYEILAAGEDKENESICRERLYTAAVLSVLLHVEAGNRAAARLGEHAVLAGDTAAEIGMTIQAHINGKAENEL